MVNFLVNKNRFELFFNNILISESYFEITEPDWLFNQKYVALFKLRTFKNFQRRGFMKYLLNEIFKYVKVNLNINYILLNVYENNSAALNLYLNSGFEIYEIFDNSDKPYLTLIKKLH